MLHPQSGYMASCQSGNQSVNHTDGDAQYVSLKKRIACMVMLLISNQAFLVIGHRHSQRPLGASGRQANCRHKTRFWVFSVSKMKIFPLLPLQELLPHSRFSASNFGPLGAPKTNFWLPLCHQLTNLEQPTDRCDIC